MWRSRTIAELRASLDFDVAESAFPVDLSILNEEELPDGVLRSFVSFRSFDGTSIPAFLLQPAGANGSRPAALVIPGHGRGIRGAAGLLEDYQNHAALELARDGYVVLVPELRGFGLLGPAIGLDHRVVATNALRAGQSYKGIVARDLQRALTALAGLPGVDDQRIGVAGASMGGELALLLGVLDDRVAATAVNSHGMHVGPVSDAEALERFAARHGCHILPAGAPVLAMEDWYRLLVPRPLLVVDGEADLEGGSASLPSRVGEFEAAVRGAYARERADSLVTIVVAKGGHEFFVDPTRDFFHRHLGEPESGSRPVESTRRRAGL
jgi:dienelactone hydrolase